MKAPELEKDPNFAVDASVFLLVCQRQKQL